MEYTEKIKFSIVIPIYNAEKYIEECITSIKKQNYQQWELILVDDGSTDNSLTICEKIAKSEPRIKLYHKNNEGVSLARNYGIKYITGDYLIFVDADDLVLPYWLDEYHKCIESYNPDICFQSFTFIPNNFHLEDKQIQSENHNYKLINTNELEKIFTKKWIKFSATWSKCYKASIIKTNNIKFHKDLNLYEDFLFTAENIKYSHTFSIIPYKGYLYRSVENSLSRKLRYNKNDIINKVIKYLTDLNTNDNISLCYKLFLKQVISDTNFTKLTTALQLKILNSAKLYKLNIPYKRFILFNIMIDLKLHTNLIRLYIGFVNKIKRDA